MPKANNGGKEKGIIVNNHIVKQVIVEPATKPNAQHENLDGLNILKISINVKNNLKRL